MLPVCDGVNDADELSDIDAVEVPETDVVLHERVEVALALANVAPAAARTTSRHTRNWADQLSVDNFKSLLTDASAFMQT